MSTTEPDPRERWRTEGTVGLACPICGAVKATDDRMGHHLFWKHWDVIEDAAD